MKLFLYSRMKRQQRELDELRAKLPPELKPMPPRPRPGGDTKGPLIVLVVFVIVVILVAIGSMPQ